MTNWRHYLGNDDITGISSVRIIIEPRAFTVDKRAGPEGLSFRSVKVVHLSFRSVKVVHLPTGTKKIVEL